MGAASHRELCALGAKASSRIRCGACGVDRKNWRNRAYQIAEAYGYRNDKDHAFEWLERARRQRDAGLPGLRTDTLLTNLHDDPRWDAFLRTMGLADDQLK